MDKKRIAKIKDDIYAYLCEAQGETDTAICIDSKANDYTREKYAGTLDGEQIDNVLDDVLWDYLHDTKAEYADDDNGYIYHLSLYDENQHVGYLSDGLITCERYSVTPDGELYLEDERYYNTGREIYQMRRVRTI